jgi:hypothetical protein
MMNRKKINFVKGAAVFSALLCALIFGACPGPLDGDPPAVSTGTLRYTVTVPEGITLAGTSRIRIEQGGNAVASINGAGFTGGERFITGNITGELLLPAGYYAIDIILDDQADPEKNARYHEIYTVSAGTAAEISFAPAPEDFLNPEDRENLTGRIVFKTTAANSSGTKIGLNLGGEITRTQRLSAPNGEPTVYFYIEKTENQTLTLREEDKVFVKMPSKTTDGKSPSGTESVFSVDTIAIADFGGDLSFVVIASEPGKISLKTTVTLSLASLVSTTASFVRTDGSGDKLTYRVGEDFERASVTVASKYSDGEIREETGFVVEGFDSDTPGTKSVSFRAKEGASLADITFRGTTGSSVDITVLADSPARLFFDYGRRIDGTVEASPTNRSYTVTRGRSLALAPVLWRIPEGAVYQWTVNGGSYTTSGEFCTFTPSDVGNYTLTVTASSDGTLVASASTTVECIAGSGGSPSTPDVSETMYSPGQFIDGGWNLSLGSYGGYIIRTVRVDNNGGPDLRIEGNAFGSWVEPGVIWVMEDENGNGQADDTWYELKGNAEDLGVEVIRRYAVTFYKNGSWEDSLGNVGTCGSLQKYPLGAPDAITFVGTCISYNWGVPGYSLAGYVDCLQNLYDISDAVQADGTPVILDHIDFVKVQSATHYYSSTFGEISTEIVGGQISGYNPRDPARKITGVQADGKFRYQFINNSGYALTVNLAGHAETWNVDIAASLTLELDESEIFFDYLGGNVNYTIAVGKVTFVDKQ